MPKHNRIFALIISLLICFNSYAKQQITLRVNDSYGPFEYIGIESAPVGFTVDVFKAVNEITNYDLKLKANKEIFNLHTTILDSTEIIATMAIIPQDGKYIATTPIGYIDHDIVTRHFSAIETWEDLNDKTVLIFKHSPLVQFIKNLNLNIKFVYIKNIPDGLRLLSSGKYDAMITSNDAAYFYINRLELSNLSIKSNYSQPIPIRFIMLNTHENKQIINKINIALKTIRTNGVYDGLYAKRFFSDNRDTLKQFEAWLMIVSIISFIILIICVLYIHWKYQTEKNYKTGSRQPIGPFITNLGKISESSPTPTIFFDVMGHIKFMNQAAHKLMNINKEVKINFKEHTLFNYTVLTNEMIEDITNNKPLNFTCDLINKDNPFNYLGDYALPINRIFDIHILPACNYGTKLNGYLTYIYDITELNEANNNNKKLITSLSQISDNQITDSYFYDKHNNIFYTINQNKICSTGITYENCLQYIHPISRSLFIEEFLSILNEEKKKATISINKRVDLKDDYSQCTIVLDAIKNENDSTIGISITTLPTYSKSILINHSDDNINFIIESSKYQLLEYKLEDNVINIYFGNESKTISLNDVFKNIHIDDIIKINETINELRNHNIDKAYLVIRFILSDENNYKYYEINLKSNNSNNSIIGAYHDITEQLSHLRELEEFKECAIKACELNNMGYIEFYVDEFDNNIIPYNISIRYDIDDENFTDGMDDKSLETFKNLLESMSKRLEIDNSIIIQTKSHKTDTIISLEFNLTPIKDDNNHIYLYIGFVKDISQIS